MEESTFYNSWETLISWLSGNHGNAAFAGGGQACCRLDVMPRLTERSSWCPGDAERALRHPLCSFSPAVSASFRFLWSWRINEKHPNRGSSPARCREKTLCGQTVSGCLLDLLESETRWGRKRSVCSQRSASSLSIFRGRKPSWKICWSLKSGSRRVYCVSEGEDHDVHLKIYYMQRFSLRVFLIFNNSHCRKSVMHKTNKVFGI